FSYYLLFPYTTLFRSHRLPCFCNSFLHDRLPARSALSLALRNSDRFPHTSGTEQTCPRFRGSAAQESQPCAPPARRCIRPARNQIGRAHVCTPVTFRA